MLAHKLQSYKVNPSPLKEVHKSQFYMYLTSRLHTSKSDQIQEIRNCEGCPEQNSSFHSSRVLAYENRFSFLYEKFFNA